jgi:hypothetical protein
MNIGRRKTMSRDTERIMKMFSPDGYKEGTPYWILPNDMITYDYNEWLEADKAYWSEKQ